MAELDNLLEELGIAFDMGKIEPTREGLCKLVIHEKLDFYIEPSGVPGSILVFTEVGIIPDSPYRRELFEAALRWNGGPPPKFGVLGFSPRENSLVLSARLEFEGLNGERLHDYILEMAVTGMSWHDAIEKGSLPTEIHMGSSPKKDSSPFGL